MDRMSSVGYHLPVISESLTRVERDRREELRTLVRAIDLLNKTDMSEELGSGNALDYSIDQKTGRPVIKVIATESGETLFQIPPETVVELVAKKANGR